MEQFDPTDHSVYSSEGRVLQIKRAREAADSGCTVVGVRGSKCIVFAAAKIVSVEVPGNRRPKTIQEFDEHMAGAYAGLTDDARVILERSKFECRSHRTCLEKLISVEGLIQYIAERKHEGTCNLGMRPYFLMLLIGGFNLDNTAHLYTTEPSGDFTEVMATAIGYNSETAIKFLENAYQREIDHDAEDLIKLALKALLEAVNCNNGFEVGWIEYDKPLQMLEEEKIAEYINAIEKEMKDGGEKE